MTCDLIADRYRYLKNFGGRGSYLLPGVKKFKNAVTGGRVWGGGRSECVKIKVLESFKVSKFQSFEFQMYLLGKFQSFKFLKLSKFQSFKILKISKFQNPDGLGFPGPPGAGAGGLKL